MKCDCGNEVKPADKSLGMCSDCFQKHIEAKIEREIAYRRREQAEELAGHIADAVDKRLAEETQAELSLYCREQSLAFALANLETAQKEVDKARQAVEEARQLLAAKRGHQLPPPSTN